MPLSRIRLQAIFLIVFIPGIVGSAFIAEKNPLEFKDAAGRTIRLERIPQRILAIGHGPHFIAHLMFMFPESRDRLIGWERRGSKASDFIPMIDPDFEKRSFPDTNPGVEQIAALHPDLVLMRGMASDPKGEALTKVGIPVVYLGLETPEQYAQDISRIGHILGNSSRADEVNRFYQSRLDRISQALTGLRESEKPSILLAMTISRGGKIAVEVPAAAWIQTRQVLLAGGRPVWLKAAGVTSGWTVVNLEQIARWDAERIVLVVWYSMDARRTIEDLKADTRWRSLRAVQNGELKAFPSDIYGWDSPDPRWILGLTWLARTLHPARFKNLDMTTEIEAFFGELYGMSKKDVTAKILPAIRVEYR